MDVDDGELEGFADLRSGEADADILDREKHLSNEFSERGVLKLLEGYGFGLFV